MLCWLFNTKLSTGFTGAIFCFIMWVHQGYMSRSISLNPAQCFDGSVALPLTTYMNTIDDRSSAWSYHGAWTTSSENAAEEFQGTTTWTQDVTTAVLTFMGKHVQTSNITDFFSLVSFLRRTSQCCWYYSAEWHGHCTAELTQNRQRI